MIKKRAFYSVDQLKKSIICGIKKQGKMSETQIASYCDFNKNFGEAVIQLRNEGKVKYEETGYVLVK